MEVILLERVGRLGTVGDVVNVKNGYGRNFLLPQKKALRATDANKEVFAARRAEIEAKNSASRAEAEKHAKKLDKIAVTLIRQSSEDGKLYGSVSIRDIEEGLKDLGHSLSRKQLELNTTIKNTGTFGAKIILHPEVTVPLTVHVVRNESDIPQEVPEELQAPKEEAGTEAAE